MDQCRTMTSGRILAVLAPLALAACAGDPIPKAELGSAGQAIQNAEQAGAQQFAPAELELARSKMDAAERAVRDDRESQARLLALEARSDANYAASKARAAAAQQAASVANRDWSALSGGVQSGASGTAAGQAGGATTWGGGAPQGSGPQGGLP
ncbi:MAG TPA: DUF4398 domain-containing protein [Azospirillum sp.]|nr:DUF4398 domain-containing protein [Azospirillum sp.]